MDTAFETETKKLVKAWVIGQNSSYIQPEKDLFYANPDEIQNYSEVLEKNKIDKIEVRYRKGTDRHYITGKISAVVPCFYVLNKEKLGGNTYPESEEHKRIKNFMYRYFFENSEQELFYSTYKKKDEIIKNTIKIKDLPIDWSNFTMSKQDFFEIGITDTFNTKRVDLFLKFKEFHPLFGEGLVIEVQLSPQSEDKTKDRTISRVLKGYSCIWINKHHFEDFKAENLELKEKIIRIESWQNVLYSNSDVIAETIYSKITKYSRLIDLKCEQTLKKITKSIYLQEGMLCPKCKIGQLRIKKGSSGSFLGCSLFPACSQTYKITINEGIVENEGAN